MSTLNSQQLYNNIETKYHQLSFQFQNSTDDETKEHILKELQKQISYIEQILTMEITSYFKALFNK